MYLVCIKQLSATNTPIQSLSLNIPTQICYGIIGASGSGKSSLLNIIAGLHGEASANVLIDNVPANRATQRIGIVSPRIQLSADARIDELLLQHAQLYHQQVDNIRQAYQRAIRLCALESISQQQVRTLSVFNQRRVVLAQAIIQQPALLLIDEPTIGLTASEQNVMIDILEGLRDRDMTLVITSRGDAPLDSLFDMIGVLANGTIIAELDQQQIRNLPRTILIRADVIPTAAYEHIVALDNGIVVTRRNIVLTGEGVRALSQILQVLLHYHVHIFAIEPLNHPLADLVNQAKQPQVLAHRYPVRVVTSPIADAGVEEETAQ
ncbi:MAG: ATP-binding cassette domain-containing protein [Roseiflexaceae bacterium]|jgi:ABC-type multidrug transport system ATPase subunit